MSSNPMALIRVIDEEESARNSLKFLLEQEGWKVRLYFSIKDFFENDNPMIPGCLISNIQVRETSGFELQIRLKKSARCRLFILAPMRMSGQRLWP